MIIICIISYLYKCMDSKSHSLSTPPHHKSALRFISAPGHGGNVQRLNFFWGKNSSSLTCKAGFLARFPEMFLLKIRHEVTSLYEIMVPLKSCEKTCVLS